MRMPFVNKCIQINGPSNVRHIYRSTYCGGPRRRFRTAYIGQVNIPRCVCWMFIVQCHFYVKCLQLATRFPYHWTKSITNLLLIPTRLLSILKNDTVMFYANEIPVSKHRSICIQRNPWKVVFSSSSFLALFRRTFRIFESHIPTGTAFESFHLKLLREASFASQRTWLKTTRLERTFSRRTWR